MAALPTPGAYPQTTETLDVPGAIGKLSTIVQKPPMQPTDRLPVIIICHGFGGNSERPLLRSIADNIVEQGMIAIRFDFNGCGKSDGEFQNMTVLNEITDLKRMISWVKQQPWTENISLVGHSQGGVVVSMTAGQLGAREIKCEVLLAPAAVLRDDAIRGTMMGVTYNPFAIKGDFIELPARGNSPALKLGRAFIQTAMAIPIYETAENYTGPALVIHGTHDRVVPYTYSERYHRVIKDSQLRLIPVDDHSFTFTNDTTALLVADWLHSRLLVD